MIEESFLKSNFIGRDGFRWWIGQIAPEKAQGDQINGSGWGNRYKVRIMGYHSYTESDLKNEDLPWAQVLLPTTAGSGAANQATSVRLSPGDSVFGFFLDGDNAQIPVISGVFGRTNKVSENEYQQPFIPYTGQTKKIKNDGKNIDPRQANESNSQCQISPKHISQAQAGQIGEKERSFFTGIGDKVYFASQNPQGVIGKMITEVDNFINAVQIGIRKVSDLIDIVVDKVQSIVSGLVGSMIDAVFRKLAPLLNKGLKILYEIVYKLVLAATQNSTIAHLAGVAAQTAMVPPIQKIQDIIPGLANTIIASLAGLIKSLLRSVVNNMKNFSTCASNQFAGSLVNDIIQKIASGLNGVLGGVSKILSLVGGFNPSGFLRGSASAIAGVASLFTFKESISDYSKSVNQWIIGRGPNEQLGPSFKDILRSANESAKLTGDSFKSAVSDIKGGASQIGSAFEGFSKNSKSSKSKCYTGPKLSCTGPKVKIFGGGGKGAKAVALVGALVGGKNNRTGSIVGVKMKNKGKKYKFPPFVEIVDECNLGRGAVARSVLNSKGEVDYIYIVSPGENYPLENIQPPYYISDIQVIDSGSDYAENDYGEDQFGNIYDLQVDNGFISKVKLKVNKEIPDPLVPNEDSSIGNPVETIRGRQQVVRESNEQRIFEDLPEITIVSSTGSGAILHPVLDTAPSPQYQFVGEAFTSIDCVE